ncbi:hypothetical protein KKH3_20050 [Pectobacterium actinidiae]|nr:hypothetical protein KKH3_20050 [Pectobacterium actinidiae]
MIENHAVYLGDNRTHCVLYHFTMYIVVLCENGYIKIIFMIK